MSPSWKTRKFDTDFFEDLFTLIEDTAVKPPSDFDRHWGYMEKALEAGKGNIEGYADHQMLDKELVYCPDSAYLDRCEMVFFGGSTMYGLYAQKNMHTGEITYSTEAPEAFTSAYFAYTLDRLFCEPSQKTPVDPFGKRSSGVFLCDGSHSRIEGTVDLNTIYVFFGTDRKPSGGLEKFAKGSRNLNIFKDGRHRG